MNVSIGISPLEFSECQSLLTSTAAEYRAKGLEIKAAHRKATEDIASIVGMDVDSFQSEMGRLRNAIGRGRKLAKSVNSPRGSAANLPGNGNGNGNGRIVLSGKGVNPLSPLSPLSPVQATLFPIKDTKIVEVAKKEKPIGHFVRLELIRVSPKKGQRVEMEFYDEKTAKDARSKIGWVARSLEWDSYRTDINGRFLYITRL